MATPTLAAPTTGAGDDAAIPGDPATLHQAAHHITTTATGFRDTAEGIAAHSRKVTANWTGTASEAARDHIEALSRRVHIAADVLGALAPLIHTYADALTAAQSAWAQAATAHTDATTALNAAHRAQTAAAAMTTTTGSSDTTAQNAAAAQAAQTAQTRAAQQADDAATSARSALDAAAGDMDAAAQTAARANEAAAATVRTFITQLAALGGQPATPATAVPVRAATGTAPAAATQEHRDQHGWLYDAIGGFGDGAWQIGPGMVGDLLGLIPTSATRQITADIRSAHDDLQDAYGADTDSGAYVGTSIGVQVASLFIPGAGEVKAAEMATRAARFFDGVRAFRSTLPSVRSAATAIRDGLATAAEEHRASAAARGMVLYSGVPTEEVAAAGRFVRTATTRTVKNLKYARPSGYRKGLRDTVWQNAEDDTGVVRDPLTQSEMKKSEPWHMGHRPGYEFRKHAASAEARGISRKQFLAEHNTPDHFRPELPSSNTSHEGEAHDDIYLGP